MKNYTISGSKWLLTQLHPGIPVHFRAPTGTGGPNVLAEVAKAKGKTLFIGGVIQGQVFKQYVDSANVDTIACKAFIDYHQEYLNKYKLFILGENMFARYRVPILATLQGTDKFIISL